jgi:hypothetical protein
VSWSSDEERNSSTLGWIVAAIVGPILGLAFVAAVVLLRIARPESSAARLDIAKVVLSVAGGIGGAEALVLAGLRQHSSDIAHRHTVADATERRITELYTKAVEQLGSDKAPVRLGGLYALETACPGQSESAQGNHKRAMCVYSDAS